ncbi:MAG: hypothetical protein RIR48_1340 [Bacteroidota bacterium]|jgi:hypothetical protein
MDNFKRREFIKLSALGFASIALQFGSISSYAQMANAHTGKWNKDTKLNWDAFLERLSQLARTQHEWPWNQKRYLKQVKHLLLQCNFPEFENIKKEIDGYENVRPKWFESSSLYYEVDFQVSLFQFEKGEYIPHHDHPDMTGILNVVSGSILAKNYTVEQQLMSTREVMTNGQTNILKKCIIREVENEIIKAGDVSILTAHEGNIHSIMPIEFTQLVDVFTPAYKHDTNANWYSVADVEFYQGKKNLYKAEYSNIKM